MPIPVGRSGNVDGEGGETDSGMHYPAMVDPWWLFSLPDRDQLREWLEPIRVQPGGALCGAWAASPQFMEFTFPGVQPTAVEPEPSLAELTNDADSDGTDGS